MMVTFSDLCDFNQLKLGLCQLTKSLNKNACLLLLFSPSVNSHLFVTPCISARQASLSFIISLSLFKLKSIKLMMPSSHLILCHPLLLLPSIFPTIRIFTNESALCIRQPKYWSFSFSITASYEYSGLISFRIDWFDLLPVQGNSQESSPAPQFKSTNSSRLSLLYGPTLTSVHAYWETHSFE